MKLYDDPSSVLHTLVAFFVSLFSPLLSISATMCFIAYQVYEKEKTVYKEGDFIEWMVGIILASIIRYLLQLSTF